MSLADVNKQFQNEQTEKYNMGVQDQLKTPRINTTESSRKCLNCDRKINNSKILKTELLLDKYKTELGLTNSDLPPNAIPIPKNKGGKNKKKTKKRKWSQKYKKSINCKKPKGFSQKQYCKYGRKKN